MVPDSSPGQEFRHTEGILNIPWRSRVAAGPFYAARRSS